MVEEENKSQGLEGKIDDVLVGDILLLQSEEVNVVGYVHRKRADVVILSYLDPNSLVPSGNDGMKQYIHSTAECGMAYVTNRTYNLKAFQSYQILDPEQQKDKDNNGHQGRYRVGDIVLFSCDWVNLIGYFNRNQEQVVELALVDPNSLIQDQMICRKNYSTGLRWKSAGNQKFITKMFPKNKVILRARSCKQEQVKEVIS